VSSEPGAGHFTAPTGSTKPKRIKPLGFNKSSIESEFEADVTAMRLVKQLNKEFSAPLSEVSLYLAPILFFELMFALRQKWSRHRITSHPHPTVRESNLIATTAQEPRKKFPVLATLIMTIRELNGEKYEPADHQDKATRLLAHVTKCLPSELDAFFFTGTEKRGMSELRTRDLLTFMEQNEEKARSATALAAFVYLISDIGGRGVYRTHLGVLLVLYLDVYEKEVCQPFIVLLQECFTDYQAIIEEARHILLDQFDNEPPNGSSS
jgi:hypothetical protein